MKIFILFLVMIFSIQSVTAQMITNTGLSRLERKVFNTTFNDDYDTRLNRLEVKVFGAQQNGTSDERYTTLKNAVGNYRTFSSTNYYPSPVCTPYPLFTYGQGSNWRRTMWNNFRNYSGIGAGMPTGITPAMDPAYMDWFEADRASKDVYYGNNHGYYRNKKRSGSGASVTILD